jgi:hypothetical protein
MTTIPEFGSKHPFQLGFASLEHSRPNSDRTVAERMRPCNRLKNFATSDLQLQSKGFRSPKQTN